jgi:chromosomal replication initiation ATPase DnaA
MTYSSVHDYFENNSLPQSNGDFDIDYDDAVDTMISICEDAEIEEFDIHDLIDYVATHYGVEPSELLEEYDNYQIRIQYRR